MSSAPPSVHIHYLRPPDNERVFVQDLLLDAPDVKVTLARDVEFETPVRVHGRTVLESGSDAVWFTFPDRWHDIGRFHLADGTFTGLYANILTPPLIREGGTVWHTTDLFLDVWLAPDGELSVLDRDQLAEAVERGWVGPVRAARAEAEVQGILAAHAATRWPPGIVGEWTLARALQEVEDATAAVDGGEVPGARASDDPPEKRP